MVVLTIQKKHGVAFWSIVGWDGVLPLVVALGPILVKVVLPKGHIAEVVATVLIPILAALLRADLGWHQIARICNGHAPWMRQMAMAGAIVQLLLFEAAVGVLTIAGDAPAAAWLFPIAFYAFYLVMIRLALRSGRQRTSPADST